MTTAIDKPKGFRPLKTGAKPVQVNYYNKTAAAVVNEGDAVMRMPAGGVQIYVKGTLQTAGLFIGIAAETHLGANTDKIAVYDDPAQEFVCQVADTYAAADDGQNVDIEAAPTADALGFSGQEIDMTTKAATTTLPFKILGLAPLINGGANPVGINSDIIVKINSSERASGPKGI